jgi:hypothetical protein
MDLIKISQEIREIISQKQKSLGLTFEEDKHIYTMNGRKDYPSVSKVLKKFYKPFPTEEAAYNKAGGDPEKQQQLIEEWAAAGDYSTNLGSRVHYVLEKVLIDKYGGYKEVRQPVFECDLTQLMKSDNMISAGRRYLDLMESRKVVLLDRKTNKPKNFEETRYTERMYKPFEKYPNTALGHYYLQLPLYAKLLIKMLQGTKYENIKLYGCIISHLKDDTSYDEYRVPKDIMDTVLEMDMKKYL